MNTKYTRLTLEDIAQEIHISRTTIYKVLNNKGNVSEKTKQTVLNALEKYHYTPNNNARNLALNKHYVIGLFIFESPDASYFAPTIHKGVQQALQRYGDHGLTVQCYTAPIGQPWQQSKDIEDAMESGIRHFIIAAADASIIAPLLFRLKEKNCTVILLSKNLPQSPYDAFIGIDEYKSGELAGEIMGKMLPNGGKLQILMAKESKSNISATKTRLNGFLHQMQQFPQVEILPVLTNLSSPKEICTALHQALTVPHLAGIFDLTYRLDYISQLLVSCKKTNLVLVGMDLFPEIEPYLATHVVDAIIFQNLKAQTVLACQLLFEKMCYGKQITKKNYYSKLEIVMNKNMEYYL